MIDGIVVVTGGASGIGYAVCERLLSTTTADVVMADINGETLARAAQSLGSTTRSPAIEQVDVTNAASITALMCGLAQRGRLRGLVNSAGVGEELSALETTPERFRTILDINLVGTFAMCRAAARAMQGFGGAIVNVASVSGIRGNIMRAAYGSSKAGVIHLTKILAAELAELNIRVNAIAPGPIETPMAAQMHSPERRNDWIRTVPLHRYGHPHEVAGAGLFLLDDEQSSYVTGQTIAVDGGFVAAGLL